MYPRTGEGEEKGQEVERSRDRSERSYEGPRRSSPDLDSTTGTLHMTQIDPLNPQTSIHSRSRDETPTRVKPVYPGPLSVVEGVDDS